MTTENLPPVGAAQEDEPHQLTQQKPHYTLAELLANSDYSQPLSAADRAWLDTKPVGRELL